MLKFHQVQPGDTLSDIAVKYKANWKDLSKKNRLRDPDKLQPGDVIMIPEQAVAPAEPETASTSAPVPPYGQSGQPFEEPAPYETSWPQYAHGGGPKPEAAQSPSPSSPPQPKQGFIEGPGWSKPYPVNANPKAERGRSPGDMGSPEGAVRPSLDAITEPSFWKDFLTAALPTALAGMRASGARMGPHMPEPKTPPSSPAQSKWLQKEQDFFNKNPGALDTVDPGYAAAREAGLAPKSNTGPGGGQLTPEGKAADVKDWNFYRRQSNDSKATPFPRKEPPVRETYPGTSAAADTRPGIKDFAQVVARELADKYFGVPIGGGGRPFYDPEITAWGARMRPIQDELGRTRDAAGETPAGPHSDFAKGTTVTKTEKGNSVEKNVSPFRAAIQGGMDRPRQDGVEVAGPGVPPNVNARPSPVEQRFRNRLIEGRGSDHNVYGNPYNYGSEELTDGPKYQKSGEVVTFPGDKSQATEGARPLTSGGGRSNVTNFERPLSQNEKYDAAVAKQKYGELKNTTYQEFEKDFHARSKLYGGFKELSPTLVHDSMRNFYRNPEATLKDLREGAHGLEPGPLRSEAIRLYQMLEEETF